MSFFCLIVLLQILAIFAEDIWKPLDLSTKLKILIVQVDSRQLDVEDPIKASYVTIAAVLNYNYAKKHGYDFVYVHPSIDVKDIEEKFNVKEPPSESLKDQNVKTSAFHPTFKRFRGASWNKIPTIWHILTTKGLDYDLVFYVDSDLAVASANSGKSIVDMYMKWRNSKDVRWGVEDITKTGMLLFSNSPYGDWEPCMAAMLMRPKLAIPMLLEWWNFDFKEKDYGFQFEQDVAWKIYQWEDQNIFSFNKSSTSMLKEWIHPVGMTINEWCFNKGWLCHATAQWIKDRHRIFRTMFREEKEESRQEEGDELKNKFRTIVKEIIETEIQLNILPVAESMEISAKSEKNKKLFEMQQKAVEEYFKKEGQTASKIDEASTTKTTTTTTTTTSSSSSSSSSSGAMSSTDMNDFHSALDSWSLYIDKAKKIAEDSSNSSHEKAKELLASLSLNKLTKEAFDEKIKELLSSSGTSSSSETTATSTSSSTTTSPQLKTKSDGDPYTDIF